MRKFLMSLVVAASLFVVAPAAEAEAAQPLRNGARATVRAGRFVVRGTARGVKRVVTFPFRALRHSCGSCGCGCD